MELLQDIQNPDNGLSTDWEQFDLQMRDIDRVVRVCANYIYIPSRLAKRHGIGSQYQYVTVHWHLALRQFALKPHAEKPVGGAFVRKCSRGGFYVSAKAFITWTEIGHKKYPAVWDEHNAWLVCSAA
jgi:hypothetical protein